MTINDFVSKEESGFRKVNVYSLNGNMS